MDNLSNISIVTKEHLCIGCGCCAGICPEQCISLGKNAAGTLVEPSVDEGACIHCGKCITVCPGSGWDCQSLSPCSYKGDPDEYLGKILGCYAGHSLDKAIRINAASGGMVTEILMCLLEKGYVDGVIVSRIKNSSTLETETYIARTRAEIVSSQKSIYCSVPAGRIYSQVLNENGKFAFVGLPCHIAGLRKAQGINKVLAERITCTVGLFCSRTPNYRATEYLLREIGVHSCDVSAIEYRGRGHPGEFRVALRDGSELTVRHLDPRYWGYAFQFFFKPLRCWLCHDHSAMVADVSCGDNWTGTEPAAPDSNGSSIVVVRASHIDQILQSMCSEKRISIKSLPSSVVSKSQNLEVKSDVIPRFRLLKILGKAVPVNYPVSDRKAGISELLSALREFVSVVITNNRMLSPLIPIYIKTAYMLHRVTHANFSFRLIRIGIRSLGILHDKPEATQSRNKIILIGGFGWKDIGDEAMPHGIIYNLKNRLPEVEIVMFSPNPELTTSFHHQTAVPDASFLSYDRNSGISRKIRVFCATLIFIYGAFLQSKNIRLRLWPGARAVLDEINSATILFNNGGGNLNSIIPMELYKKCSLYWVASILHKPIIISGQTIGPFSYWFDRKYAKFCLNKADFISFRDKNHSRKILTEIGVTRPFMTDAADDAMTIPTISSENAKKILESEAPASWLESGMERCVVMNLKGSMSAFQAENETMDEDSVVRIMARVSDYLIENHKVKIFCLPTDYTEGVDDRVLHRKLIQFMKYKKEVFCIEQEYDDSTLKGLISLADYAIGSRYHFCVFAASVNVPFFGLANGIYQKAKLKGLADLYGTPQCFFREDILCANYEQILSDLTTFLAESDSIRRIMSDMTPVLKERSLLGVSRAEDIIRHNNNSDKRGTASNHY